MTMQQISEAQYESAGKLPVATVAASIAELEAETGLRFEDDTDDLDNLKLAFIRVSSGSSYALIHHDQSPERSIMVYGDPGQADLAELSRELQIPGSAVFPSDIVRERKR